MSNLLTRFLVTGLVVFFLMACSKPTDTHTVSWKISVDGKTVLAKDATNDKVAALNLTLLELRLKIEGACHLGQFIHESSPTDPSQKNTNITSGPNSGLSSGRALIETPAASQSMQTSGALQNQHVVNLTQSSTQSFTQLKLTPEVALAVNQKMANHLCTIQKAQNQGCTDESRKTSKKIPLDHLQLLAYVQNEFGMKGAAEIVFDETYLSADKTRKNVLSQTVKINKNSFSCDLVNNRLTEPKKSVR
jgi:hypothetical protein